MRQGPLVWSWMKDLEGRKTPLCTVGFKLSRDADSCTVEWGREDFMGGTEPAGQKSRCGLGTPEPVAGGLE